MDAPAIDVCTEPDGTVVIRPSGVVDADDAVHLQRVLVHTVRKVRPSRLILDLSAVYRLDPISAGTVSAACELGDDHQVAVCVHHTSARIAHQLAKAGVPPQRLHDGKAGTPPPPAEGRNTNPIWRS
ncbi:STAS domain-containing protein [Actinoplanes sp. KI2]|uniref:STAS domain-containing protein n=1 Tax=Actinoplanes sp. KI2 TaxID=2983315 RepID=UPI0021D5881B|nr:STAS domain-containing protein [Actinoplanes sp. KI2]MCU7730097.1 STAS domain-containing protein [Actinoplanes sp. KI2]